MTSLLKLLKPAPHITPISDPEIVKKDYHYWRFRILYSMFVGYALYYFTRQTLTFAKPGLIEDLHLDKGQLGLLSTIFSLTYGMSKFASGVLSDRSNPRYFMAIGLMITGVVNICFGLFSSMVAFVIFWGLNGWFQGFGWPPCARFLTHWYSHSERGSWWSTWNVSHNVGSFLIPWLVGALLQFLGWQWAMYIPGIICICGGFFLINRLRDTPQSLGLPPIEKFRNDYGSASAAESEKELTTKEMLFDYVLKNKFIWMLAIAYFFIYFVRIGINEWTALFLIEEKGYSRIGANGCVSMFEAGGFLGSLTAGWASDRLFGAKRGPINVLFTLGILLSIGVFWLLPEGYLWLDFASVFMIGFCVFGPQMLIGVAAAELSHKNAAATATGFIGWIAYIGAAVAGFPLGKIADVWGWEGCYCTIAICCGFAFLFLAPLWNVTERARPPEKQPELA